MTEHRWGKKQGVNKSCCLTMYLLILATFLFLPISSSYNDTCHFTNASQLSWKDLLQCCQMEGFKLSSVNEITNDTLNSACLLDKEKRWTTLHIMQPWIELIGCYKYNASSLLHDVEDIRLCFVYCLQYMYFGLQNTTCICMEEKPKDVTNTGCVSRKSTNSVYGTHGTIAVYKQGAYTNGTNSKSTVSRCMSVSCGNSDQVSWSRHNCSLGLPVLCQDGSFGNDSVTWMDASKVCGNQSNPAGKGKIMGFCNSTNENTNQSFWVNTHLETIVVYASVADQNRDIKPVLCGNVSLLFSFPTNNDHGMENYSIMCLDNRITYSTESTLSTSSTSTIYMGNITSSTPTSGFVVEQEENQIIYIAAGCGAGALLVIVVITVVCCRCRKANKEKDVEGKSSILPENTKTYTSNETKLQENGASFFPSNPSKQAYEMVDIDNEQIKSEENVTRKISNRTNSNNSPESLSDQGEIKENPNEKQAVSDTEKSPNSISHKDQYSVVVKIGKQGNRLEDKNASDFEIKNTDDHNDSEKENIEKTNSTNKDDSPCKRKFDHTTEEDDYDSISSNEINMEKNSSETKEDPSGKESENQDDDDYDFINENSDINVTNDKMKINNNTNIGDDCQMREIDNSNQSNDKLKQKVEDRHENDEDDYDRFERNKTPRPSSNYDHVTLRHTLSNKDRNINDNADLEDYDHLQMSPKRQDLVDSTYDRAHVFNYQDTYNQFNRDNASPTSDTYDRLSNDGDEDDYATAGSDNDSRKSNNDYEISDEMPAVRIHNDGERDSYYTTVSLPGTDDSS